MTEVDAKWLNEHLRKMWGLDDPDEAAIEIVQGPNGETIVRRRTTE